MGDEILFRESAARIGLHFGLSDMKPAFLQLEERPGPSGEEYWRFAPRTLGHMVELTVDELTAGHRASNIAQREDDIDTAETLKHLLSKVRAMFRVDCRRRVAADL